MNAGMNNAYLNHSIGLQKACAAAMEHALFIANMAEPRLSSASKIAAEVRARRPEMHVKRVAPC